MPVSFALCDPRGRWTDRAKSMELALKVSFFSISTLGTTTEEERTNFIFGVRKLEWKLILSSTGPNVSMPSRLKTRIRCHDATQRGLNRFTPTTPKLLVRCCIVAGIESKSRNIASHCRSNSFCEMSSPTPHCQSRSSCVIRVSKTSWLKFLKNVD